MHSNKLLNVHVHACVPHWSLANTLRLMHSIKMKRIFRENFFHSDNSMHCDESTAQTSIHFQWLAY